MDPKKFKKIALVGATVNPRKYGNVILKDLVSKGFEVLPVNPKYDEIEGFRVYKSVEELPEDIDVIVFVVPPEVALEETKKAYDVGFRRFWYQPGAFSEEIKRFLDSSKDVEYSAEKCIMVETSSSRGFLNL
ncbi:MAG TPA: CoA-binding protein [Thermotoga sp.]|uniref:CoA-binding protein n=1 Tax=Thermotoga sp. (strain RQ2) TaxID=126740 RepID=UPI0001601312|nr:CoA-binding protein [Thermotoga sp. RQ2]ACB09671.1 CoA-binding domain protein [Thermotoga sp. RQ2]HBF69940.1 CoA-binding protein [Thermotoga sp.]